MKFFTTIIAEGTEYAAKFMSEAHTERGAHRARHNQSSREGA